GRGAGRWAAGPEPRFVTVGEFNGDGVADLVVIFRGGVRVLLGTGDGSFRTTHVSYSAGLDPQAAAGGDFDGDGWLDLAVVNKVSRDVSSLLNDGYWPTSPGRTPRGGSGGGSLPADLAGSVVVAARFPSAPLALPGAVVPAHAPFLAGPLADAVFTAERVVDQPARVRAIWTQHQPAPMIANLGLLEDGKQAPAEWQFPPSPPG